jgi:extracellular factor (EF) 3-hydroxypalmitic acid methyl ester biosynthesis protein
LITLAQELRSGRETNFIEPEVVARQHLDLATRDFLGEMSRISRELAEDTLDTPSVFAQTRTAATILEQQLRRILVSDAAWARELGITVREQTSQWFMRSQFHARAFTKPQGYAGDYYTIELLYAAVPRGTGLIGCALDAWALGRPAARAVRNRRVYVAETVRHLVTHWPPGQEVAICSLGSGPARELVDLLRQPTETGIHATCIDMDPDALAYAQAQACVAGVLNRFSFVQGNVVQMARGDKQLPGKQHVIYSMGLFDYLPDRVAVAVLNWAYAQLHSGGTLLVGNVDTANPTRAYMDHLLDWRLIHRSADQLRQLFAHSHFGAQPVDVTRDATGVQLFATCVR